MIMKSPFEIVWQVFEKEPVLSLMYWNEHSLAFQGLAEHCLNFQFNFQCTFVVDAFVFIDFQLPMWILPNIRFLKDKAVVCPAIPFLGKTLSGSTHRLAKMVSIRRGHNPDHLFPRMYRDCWSSSALLNFFD